MLSEDATGAQRASYAESSLEGGLLFGDGPLEAREDGAVGYLLRVTEAAKDSEAGTLASSESHAPFSALLTWY